MRIVSLNEIQASLDLDAAIAAVREGFIAYSAGRVQLAAVGHLTFPAVGGDCHVKSASMEGSDVFVVKVSSGFPRNTEIGLKNSNGLMIVLDPATGLPMGILQDEGTLTDQRAAIAGGLAAALIRPDDATAIGILGTGIQARLNAEIASRLTGIDRVVLWGRDAAKARRLADELSADGIPAEAVDNVAEICRRTRLIIATTASTKPIITQANAIPGLRIVALGADAPGKQEVETSVVAGMDLLVADSLDQCLHHGELAWPRTAGLIDTDRIEQFGHLLADPPKLAAESSALVDLTGLGIQDLQISAVVWRAVNAAARS